MFLQSETNTDGSVTIWPTKETRLDRTEELVTVLYVGQRCVHHRRIAYSIQCEHEYVMDGGLDIHKYHPRWYHRQTFDTLLPELAGLFERNRSAEWRSQVSQPLANLHMQRPVDGTGNDAENDTENIDPGSIDAAPDNDTSVTDAENSSRIRISPSGEKVTFHHITERCTELARAVQNDQVIMNTLFSNLNQMIERVRLGRDIHINFSSGILETLNRGENINVNCPRADVSRVCTNSTGVKRKQSACEFNSRHKRNHRKHVSMSQVMASNDDEHLPPAINRT
jgi:hypothetical protein